MSVYAFLVVGHVRASNMVNPSLASVFLERFFRLLASTCTFVVAWSTEYLLNSNPNVTIYAYNSFWLYGQPYILGKIIKPINP